MCRIAYISLQCYGKAVGDTVTLQPRSWDMNPPLLSYLYVRCCNLLAAFSGYHWSMQILFQWAVAIHLCFSLAASPSFYFHVCLFLPLSPDVVVRPLPDGPGVCPPRSRAVQEKPPLPSHPPPAAHTPLSSPPKTIAWPHCLALPMPWSPKLPSCPSQPPGAPWAVALASWTEFPQQPAFPCQPSARVPCAKRPSPSHAAFLPSTPRPVPISWALTRPSSSGCLRKVLTNANFKLLPLITCGFIKTQPLKYCKFHREFIFTDIKLQQPSNGKMTGADTLGTYSFNSFVHFNIWFAVLFCLMS